MSIRKIATVAALLAVFLTSCGDGRPSSEEWRPDWQQVLAAVPDEASLVGADSTVAICGETLAFLRSNRADLLPAPDLAIDDAVTRWFEIAEDAFFECPPHNNQAGSFAEAYAEMRRLEAEIDLVLDLRIGTL